MNAFKKISGWGGWSELKPATKADLNKAVKQILMNQAELAAQLALVQGQVAKIGTETAATLQKVADLEAALQNAGTVSPEVASALDALKVQAQAVDDLVPDAPAPTEPPTT